MKRLMNRFIALTLIVISIISMFPPAVSSVGSQSVNEMLTDTKGYDGSEIDQVAVAEEMELKAGQGIAEIESLREENSKHFQLEDGSYQAIVYDMAVHRKDVEGKWQDIDNRLYIDTDDPNRYATNDGMFSFAESSSSKTLYTIKNNAYTISFGLVFDCANTSNAVIENHQDRLKNAQYLEGKEKLDALINVDTTTRVKYNDVLENVDLEYVISGNDVIENIIISNPISINSFKFKMMLCGLTAELSEEGSIKLVNENGEEVYFIAAPFMYDAAGVESRNVAYSLEKDDDGYTVVVNVDENWINEECREFPVIIDPTATKNISGDTYISSANPSTNYGQNGILYVSSSKITYMRAGMPSLPIYAKITNATLTAKYYFPETSGSMEIGLYRCVRSWNEDTLTWNTANAWSNKGLATSASATTTAVAASGINSNNPGTISFTITTLVKRWYAGTSNYGFGLKYKEGTLSSIRIHSRETTSTIKPYYSITYTVISDPVIENGTYFIKNKKTGKYVDIENQSTSVGAYIHQWEFHSDASQRWLFEYTHNGNYYTIKSVNSNSPRYLGVKDDSTDADVRIVLRTCVDSNGTKTFTNGMLWGVSITDSGAYKIRAITGEANGNDRVLAVGWYLINSNGIDIEQRDYSADTNYIDEWILSKPESTEYAIFMGSKVSSRSFKIQCKGELATGTTWYPLIQASASAWNDTSAGTSITVGTTNSAFTCEVNSYVGNWLGVTIPTVSNGTITSATIKINSRECGTDSNSRKSTITHEIGHLLGLNDDPPVSNNASLMNHERDRSTIYIPQSYDIMNVEYIYSIG